MAANHLQASSPTALATPSPVPVNVGSPMQRAASSPVGVSVTKSSNTSVRKYLIGAGALCAVGVILGVALPYSSRHSSSSSKSASVTSATSDSAAGSSTPSCAQAGDGWIVSGLDSYKSVKFDTGTGSCISVVSNEVSVSQSDLGVDLSSSFSATVYSGVACSGTQLEVVCPSATSACVEGCEQDYQGQ
eukprot:TRINITY_DN3344_c0_g1_i2.p1 TRINITY_DN3344_c0_g1~~TRINITY_DN3344_c0_g1_i2.p1  ORF type:complete len:189 (-),score=23.99 TRINITY_DN3344_c0_g1_i2:74-640(-)